MTTKLKDDKKLLYSLILSQLQKDGYNSVATALSQETLIPIRSKEKEKDEDRLMKIFQYGLQRERETATARRPTQSSSVLPTDDAEFPEGSTDDFAMDLNYGSRLDFDSEQNVGAPKRLFPNYTTKFITTHKSSCRCAKFSPDGQFVATGSSDTSIKLLDVQKMKNYNQMKSEHGEDYAPAKPVIRTFYDHSNSVNDLDFHPVNPILISAGKDNTIKFYDYSQSANKRSFKFIQDAHNVRSIHFHPSGDFILAGTEHNMIKLYDVNTLQCYIGSKPSEHHLAPINQVRYAPEGNIYVSCAKDGLIKLWDTVSSTVINTIQKPHGGFEVTTVQFSKNQKYLLSAGKDGTIRLWELSTGRQIQHIFTGAQWKHRLQVAFSHNEDFIVSADESTYASVVWDSRTGEVVQKLQGHTNVVTWIASSPTENALITCSNDHRARFWVEEINQP